MLSITIKVFFCCLISSKKLLVDNEQKSWSLLFHDVRRHCQLEVGNAHKFRRENQNKNWKINIKILDDKCRLILDQTKILLNTKTRIKLPASKKPCPAALISVERHNHPQASRSLHHRRSKTLAAETIPVPIAVVRFLIHCFRCVLHVFFLL